MTPGHLLATALAGVGGYLLGPWVSWAVRSWPGHEALLPIYHDCARCPGGIRRRCVNAGTRQDTWLRWGTAVLAAALIASCGPTPRAVLGFIFSLSCVVITIVDVRYLIIPDILSIGGFYLGLSFWTMLALLPEPGRKWLLPGLDLSFIDSASGAALGFTLLWGLGWLARVLLKKEGMGGGDVKLLAAIGAWLGWQAVLATVVLASILGSVGGIAGILWQKLRYGRPYSPFSHMIPFGPYLCAGFLFVYFAGFDPLYKLLDLYQVWLERHVFRP